jgi:hypothetical protein
MFIKYFFATDAHRQNLGEILFAWPQQGQGQANQPSPMGELWFKSPKGLRVGGRQVVLLLSSSCLWQKKEMAVLFSKTKLIQIFKEALKSQMRTICLV